MNKLYFVMFQHLDDTSSPVAIFDNRDKAVCYRNNKNERVKRYYWVQEVEVDVEALNGRA